ncbi:concanavalin A-like lectin/glucanase domain-containing protein [Cercophora scortea]|uniref:Concanavalin A-like lectin/glucanase domain-containing protein n=1 Tax=Cercophora scortea TaxID=314031 RepID=A0AAE0IW26_9PEZI|nr:concanavalin A-like lectin/glucanase domain-containing protein [Cercophora scortea]
MLLLGHALAVTLWARHIAARHPAHSQYDATICGLGSYTSSSDNLTFNSNAWNPDSPGFQCLSVQDSPPKFDATWAWADDPGSVHSYPHVKFTSPALPVTLSNISALLLSVKWSMGPGSTPRPALNVDSTGLADRDTVANVAFDIFADRNTANAQNETTAETEIMIWLGKYGSAKPLGFALERTCFNQTISDVEFVLYQGHNARGTNVLTWMSTANRTSFAAEISPLLQYLWRNGLVSAGSNIGLVSFGSEAYHSEGNVTFSASDFGMTVVTGPAPNLAVGSLPTSCAKPEAPPDESGAVSLHARGSWPSRVAITMFVGVVAYFLS